MILHNGFIDGTITYSGNKEIDLDALNLLASGVNKDLCVCGYKNEKGRHHFIYETENLIAISQLYANFMFEDAIEVLSAALSLVEFSYNNNLILDNIKISKEHIFKLNDSYLFVYVPIARKSRIEARNFILKLISIMHIKDMRINQLVKEIRKIKNDEQMLHYLKKFLTSYKRTDSNSEDETSLLVSEGATSLLISEDEISTLSDNNTILLVNSDSYREKYDSQRAETSLLFSEGETTILSNSNYQTEDVINNIYNSQQLPDELNGSSESLTTLLYDESTEYETTVLTSQPEYTQPKSITDFDCKYSLCLIRSFTGQKIVVHITPFTIGKERSNMNCVLDDENISHHHATITWEDGNYYIMDNHSTNGTVVEGIKLEPYEKVLIENGCIISMGNESFRALIERR